MKLRFYIDLWNGQDPARWPVYATTQPGQKTDDSKRLAFDVTIPDHLVYSIDEFSPEVSRPEIIDDATMEPNHETH